MGVVEHGDMEYDSGMKKKEWLIANGHLDPSKGGRGRLSAEHDALLREAVANGANIEGYSVSKPTSTTDKPATVTKTAVAEGTIADTPEETVPEKYNIAMVGGKVIGNRTVCDNCRRSLNFHICGSPKVMDNGVPAVVVFKPRPNPESYRPNAGWYASR